MAVDRVHSSMHCDDMQIAHEIRIVPNGKCIWRSNMYMPLCAQVIVSFVSGERNERPLISAALAPLKRNRNETIERTSEWFARPNTRLYTLYLKICSTMKTRGEISLYKQKIYCRFFFFLLFCSIFLFGRIYWTAVTRHSKLMSCDASVCASCDVAGVHRTPFTRLLSSFLL